MWESESMRTTVRATCPLCGDIRLSPDEMAIRTLAGYENADQGHHYRFRCPRCKAIIVKETNLGIVKLLLQAGVAQEVWELPLELLERPSEWSGPTISLDDVLDLHETLEQNEEAWLERMRNEEG